MDTWTHTAHNHLSICVTFSSQFVPSICPLAVEPYSTTFFSLHFNPFACKYIYIYLLTACIHAYSDVNIMDHGRLGYLRTLTNDHMVEQDSYAVNGEQTILVVGHRSTSSDWHIRFVVEGEFESFFSLCVMLTWTIAMRYEIDNGSFESIDQLAKSLVYSLWCKIEMNWILDLSTNGIIYRSRFHAFAICLAFNVRVNYQMCVYVFCVVPCGPL